MSRKIDGHPIHKRVPVGVERKRKPDANPQTGKPVPCGPLACPPPIKIDLVPLALPSIDPQALKSQVLARLQDKEEGRGFSDQELEPISQAFDHMITLHENEYLPSGEPMIIHLLGVAETLARWGAGPNVIAASLLLLDKPEEFDSDAIDPDVKTLVKDQKCLAAKLFIELKEETTVQAQKEQAKLINRMCWTAEKNRDVWLLVAADLYISLSTNIGEDKLQDKKIQAMAFRGFWVVPTILNEFNLEKIALQLEDAAFIRLDKEEYEKSKSYLEELLGQPRQCALEDLKTITEWIGEKLPFKYKAEADVKSISRTYKKLKRGDDLTDPNRFRFIVSGPTSNCLVAFEVIKQVMEGELGYIERRSERKNYINGIKLEGLEGEAKDNGYQAIHVLYILYKNREEKYASEQSISESIIPVSIQITTEELHNNNEVGTAAHGLFKVEVDGLAEAREEGLGSLGVPYLYGVYNQNICRVTPGGEYRALTLLDLVFASDPLGGLLCPEEVWLTRPDKSGRQRRVNVSVYTKLQNGDQIEFVLKEPKMTPRNLIHLLTRRLAKVSSLTAEITLKLAISGDLDTTVIKQRTKEVAVQGKAELDHLTNRIKLELETRMNNILRKKVIGGATVSPVLSFERVATLMGLNSVEQLHLAIGLSEERDVLLRRVEELLLLWSSVAASKTQDGSACCFMIIQNRPGVLHSLMKVFEAAGMGIAAFKSNSLLNGNSLVEAHLVRPKKMDQKEFEKSVKTLSKPLQGLYSGIRLPKFTTCSKVKVDLVVKRVNTSVIGEIAAVLAGLKANIEQINIEPPIEGNTQVSSIILTAPYGKFIPLEKLLKDALYRLGHSVSHVSVLTYKN